MTTTSPVSLSLSYRAENKRFSTLKRIKTGGIQPKLNVACFVVQSCLADADFVVFSNYCLIGTRQMVARFLLFRRQSPVGMPQQPYWQARQFVSKKKSLSIIAWSACCTAVSKPSSRSLHTPSMVVPPGEHAAFMSAMGARSCS